MFMVKKRICHFSCAHTYNDVRVFQKECVSLAKAGNEVYYVVPNKNSTLIEGVNVIGVSSKSANPLYRVLFLAKTVYKEALKVDADIYHFHDIELFEYGLKLKNKGKVVIFDSHEDWPQYTLEIAWLPMFIKRILFNRLARKYRKNLNKFDKVITVSPHIVENFAQFSNAKVELITNYPQMRLLNPIDKNEFCNRSNIICYAGTVYRNSCQEEIVEAIQSINDVEYYVVGKIDDEYKSILQSIDIKNKVRFINWVSKDELLEIYQKSLIGVIIFEYSPNVGYKKGTMGNNKVFEYMSMGLPIICTNFISWNELIIGKYKCGIAVEPNSVEQILNAIKNLIENKELAFSMGQNGQRAVNEEFNWTTQEQQLLRIYSEL